MKRVYTTVSTAVDGGTWLVLLDGRPVNTPGRRRLALQTAALAEAVAAEWAEQGEQIRPQSQPLTRLAATCVDKVAPSRDTILDAIATYGETDLICYLAETPQALRARQLAAWQPWQAWASATLGAPLRLVDGIMPVAQPPQSLARLRAAAQALDDAHLTIAQAATPLLGSLVLALAFARDALDAQSAYGLSLVEEHYQQEFWGLTEEAAERQQRLAADMRALQRYRGLLDPCPEDPA